MGRRWVAPAGVHRECKSSLGREEARPPRAAWRRDEHHGQKRGDGIGYSGYKHQKGEKVIAITDNHGYVLSPLPVAPVNETDMGLLPDGLKAFKKVATQVGLDLRDAYVNLDAGVDSTDNRTCMFNAGMIPGSVPLMRHAIVLAIWRRRPDKSRWHATAQEFVHSPDVVR